MEYYLKLFTILIILSIAQACSSSDKSIQESKNTPEPLVSSKKTIDKFGNQAEKSLLSNKNIRNTEQSKNNLEKSSPIKDNEKQKKVVSAGNNKSVQINNQSEPSHNKLKIQQAKLTIPQKVKVNQTVPVSIDLKTIKTNSSKAQVQQKLNKLNENHIQKMNLVLVSDDLRFFDFVNSSYQGNGKFEVKPKFPSPGIYSLFSTYQVSNTEKQVFLEKINIPGKVSLPKELETYSKTKKLGDTKVNLNLSQPRIKVGQPVTLKFDVRESKTNKVVTNLQDYLGTKAQLVIIKSSYPLSKSDFIPNQIITKPPDNTDNKFHFKTSFPNQGAYKIWLKFNRGGKVKTADFWVRIS